VSFSIQPNTIYLKTPQGRAEVTARALGLTMLQRRLLILSDGKITVGQLQPMLGQPIDALLQHLVGLGLLHLQGSAVLPAVPAAVLAPARAPAQVLAQVASQVPSQVASQVSSLVSALAPTPSAAQAFDEYEASEEDLNSDFSEVLGADSVSHFERDSSQMIGLHTDPSSTLQRAITSRGIALGRAYLINLSSRLLDARDARLVRSIGQIKTEGDLYHQFELVIDTIGTRLGSAAINEILEQFDEQINQA
jgi:hypothetical protein